jgi:nicotinamidase-related amidase
VTASRSKSQRAVARTKRLRGDQCFAAIIDVQEFFLTQIEDRRRRTELQANLIHLARLLKYFGIPILATLERPVFAKGNLPSSLKEQLSGATFLEKDFFDLTKEKKIAAHLAKLKKRQAIVAGCETDVCVMQSCLGLLDLGYEVFAVDELLFSSASNVEAARTRLREAGVTFLSYKTLYFELIEAVDGGPHAAKMLKKYGEFPEDVPEYLG